MSFVGLEGFNYCSETFLGQERKKDNLVTYNIFTHQIQIATICFKHFDLKVYLG